MATGQPSSFTTSQGSRGGRAQATPGSLGDGARRRSAGRAARPPAALPGARPPCPRAAPGAARPPRPENPPRRSGAGPERVKSASVPPPATGRGGGGRRRRQEPAGQGPAGEQRVLVLSPGPDSHDAAGRSARLRRRGSSARAPRGASGSPARREARASPGSRTPPSVPAPGVPRSALREPRRANPRPPAPRPSPSPGGGAPGPERWGRYKGPEVTERGRNRDGTYAGAPGSKLQVCASSAAPVCPFPRDPDAHPSSRLAGSWPRSARAASAPNANSCSPRRRRPPLCQLVRTHFDQRRNPDL